MIRHKQFKKAGSLALIILACWIAVPKVYVHHLLGHNHAQASRAGEGTEVAAGSVQDCNFEKYDKPVFFPALDWDIAGSHSPVSEQLVFSYSGISPLKTFDAAHALRGPPATL